MTLNDPDLPSMSRDRVHQLLARAIELEFDDRSETSVRELREIARDAGISDAALNKALAESTPGSQIEESGVRGLARRAMNWFRRPILTGPDEGQPLPNSLWRSVLTNLLAFGAFWLILLSLASLSNTLGVPWQVRKAVDPFAMALGGYLAHRVRGRLAFFVLVGLTVSQTAELALDLFYGRPAIDGGAPHLGLMIAGLVGVAAGALLSGRSSSGSSDQVAPPVTSTSKVPSAEPGASSSSSESLMHVLHRLFA